MHYSHIAFAILGFSASFLLYFPYLRRRRHKQIAAERLRIVSQALEQAEEQFFRYAERHDRMLNQICSHYIVNQEMIEALKGTQDAMNEALEFVGSLRNMELRIIGSYSGAGDSCV